MQRATFLVSIAAAAFLPSGGRRLLLARERVRSVARLGRDDRSLLVGSAGACASRRAPSGLAGFTLADVL